MELVPLQPAPDLTVSLIHQQQRHPKTDSEAAGLQTGSPRRHSMPVQPRMHAALQRNKLLAADELTQRGLNAHHPIY